MCFFNINFYQFLENFYKNIHTLKYILGGLHHMVCFTRTDVFNFQFLKLSVILDDFILYFWKFISNVFLPDIFYLDISVCYHIVYISEIVLLWVKYLWFHHYFIIIILFHCKVESSRLTVVLKILEWIHAVPPKGIKIGSSILLGRRGMKPNL